MRFMVIVKANAESEAGVLPSSEMIAAMGRYNDELIAAGVMLAGEGLRPSSEGARIKYENGKVTVTDGPFAETKELIAGYWLLDVKSKEEALEWIRRIPFTDGEEVELRKVFEASDFPVDAISEEHLKKEAAWREATQKPIRH
ncbi:MAG TPA: YciI family protein [Devosiaceae bacterium]|nr:YciI family protein [Devosiaceae bacterium]